MEMQDKSSTHEEFPRSDQEQDPEVFFQPSQAQGVTNMFMPYIEGPYMDVTVMMVYIIDSLNGT